MWLKIIDSMDVLILCVVYYCEYCRCIDILYFEDDGQCKCVGHSVYLMIMDTVDVLDTVD